MDEQDIRDHPRLYPDLDDDELCDNWTRIRDSTGKESPCNKSDSNTSRNLNYARTINAGNEQEEEAISACYPRGRRALRNDATTLDATGHGYRVRSTGRVSPSRRAGHVDQEASTSPQRRAGPTLRSWSAGRSSPSAGRSSPSEALSERTSVKQLPVRVRPDRADRRTPPDNLPATIRRPGQPRHTPASDQLRRLLSGAGPRLDWLWPVAVAALLVVATFGVWTLWVAPAPPSVRLDGSRPLPPHVRRWAAHVTWLAERFPHQRPSLWRVVRATVSRMLMEGRQPAVLLLLASEAQRADLRCLMSAVAAGAANATDSARPPLALDGAALAALPPADAKDRLNAALNSLRSGDGVPVVLLQDLQRLRPRTAMLLHGFCDNGNAPRTDAVFLLALTAPLPPPSSQAFLQDAVEQLLWLAWGDVLGKDIFDALLTRIAGNLVAVADEGRQLPCDRSLA